ncbi:MAG: hypothetical protein EXR72_25390 [Myxococcales bacterium]|nr:hypothetical protein [Myxococcales bacterium]
MRMRFFVVLASFAIGCGSEPAGTDGGGGMNDASVAKMDLAALADLALPPDIALPPSCSDTKKNGDESDVDCGGACTPCVDGKICGKGSDCKSGVCSQTLCAAPSCMDQVKNGSETDTDCGGSCGACDDGKTCGMAADCKSGVCSGGACAAPGCMDGVKNGGESDIDCGGMCGPCMTGKKCNGAADCASGVCAMMECVPASCADKTKNGDETDLDCGGSCGPCEGGKKCAMGADCASGVCTGNACAAPSCMDAIKNGTETDADCGGSCGPCSDGKKCAMAADCSSGVCTGNACAAPSCKDAVKNGDETDLDCGGACGPCSDGKKCGKAADCTSGVCTAALCASPSCKDLVKNGDESDLDCGGSCGPCGDGKKCVESGDCQSGVCTANVCAAPSCKDLVKNGDETDADCGGSCPACAIGKKCGKSGDCASGVCAAGQCASPSCKDLVKNGDETDLDCGGACPPCAIGKACKVDVDCKPNLCLGGACKYASSCADLKKHDAMSPSGAYTIQPPGGNAPVNVVCDQTTDGGGWTQFLQCLPGDACKVGNAYVYNVDWLGSDYGAIAANKSWAIGLSLASLTSAGHFLVEVTDTQKLLKTGAVIYPLTVETRKFFSAVAFYQSEYLTTGIIDTDGAITKRKQRICWTPTVSPYARSYQGFAGLPFLGRTSTTPNDMANTGCDFGPWDAQMLLRSPAISPLTTTWGMQPVAGWNVQAYAHRLYIREAPLAPITIVTKGAGRTWSDGNLARSCADYKNPPAGARTYAGITGDGVYTVKPDVGVSALDVYCDMTTDGGGWTMVQRTVWDWASSQMLHTDYSPFYTQTVGTLGGAWRAAGFLWAIFARDKEYLLVNRARKANDNKSCDPLYYKATGGTIAADPNSNAFALNGLKQLVVIADQAAFSTKNSGPGTACVVSAQGVPWFYSGCCSTCPTYKGGYWNDEPHPMASYLKDAADLNGKKLADVCGGAPAIVSQGYYGINQMDFFVR